MCCVVLCLRDILDAPEVTQRVWESEGAYDAVRRDYGRILISGSKEMFNTCSTCSLPVLLTGTHYCGYVVKRDPVKRAKEVRQAAGIRKGHFIFVSAGGGGDGQLLMRTYVRAIRLLPPGADLFTLMAVGVNAPSAFASELVAEARGLPIRIVPYVDDSASCIAAADLVVCMAGYNTLSEVLYLKKKALVIPRSGPSAEQTMRARLLAERHLIDVLHPSNLFPEKLAERLLEDLERGDYPLPDRALPMDGATQAAGCLAELLPEGAYALSR